MADGTANYKPLSSRQDSDSKMNNLQSEIEMASLLSTPEGSPTKPNNMSPVHLDSLQDENTHNPIVFDVKKDTEAMKTKNQLLLEINESNKRIEELEKLLVANSSSLFSWCC